MKDTNQSLFIGEKAREQRLMPDHLCGSTRVHPARKALDCRADHRLFSPSDESIESVRAWLKQARINEDRQSLNAKRGWIWFEVQAAETEGLLQSEYNLYQLSESRGYHIGCDEYRLPALLHPHIDFITPTIAFPESQKEITPRQLPRASSPKQAVLEAPASLDLEASTSIDSSLTPLAYFASVMKPDCIKGVFIHEAISLAHLLTL
ncbi:MAG: hypothetical protein Q9187_002263 [Circinaria calcarea]